MGGLASGFLPDIAGQHFTRDNAALIGKEVLEQVEFPRGQLQGLAAADHAVAGGIHFQVGEFEAKAHIGLATTEQNAGAGQQFGEGERLDQVIVGARVQSFDAIFDGVA